MDGIRPTIRIRPRGSGAHGSSTFTELAQQIRDRGLLRRRYGYYWSKLVGAPLVLAACLGAFVWIGDTWWQLFTAAVLAIVFTQIAFLGQDAAHRQIFASGRWNDWTSLVLGDLPVGMSYGWWQHKHTRHHANPNKLGSDPDIELPVIALTAETAARQHNPLATWLRARQGCCSSRSGSSRGYPCTRRACGVSSLVAAWSGAGWRSRSSR
jgi:fatty acid desaturase